ncbi:hypothetical protein MYVA_3198 [Mycolicibacterium vaccae 95051]|nr:hypothetical protein MYVA_3198 [Mycolicibacterium vaccae 95051]
MTTTSAPSEVFSTTWPTRVLSAAVIDDDPAFVAQHIGEVRRLNALSYRRFPAPKTLTGLFDFLPEVVSLAHWQTPFKDQLDRGTCYAFATCAGMEAAYRRQHHVTLDLSEQFAFHINKAGELIPGFHSSPKLLHENNSSFWGFQGSSDIVTKLARSAIPLERHARYLSHSDMNTLRLNTPGAGALISEESTPQSQIDAFEYTQGHIPLASRYRARYRVTGFRSLGDDPSDILIQAVLSQGHEVIADIPGHCYLIVGYDRGSREWLVKDSRGQNTFIRVPFGAPAILGAHYITAVCPPESSVQKDAWWIGRWNVDHDGWTGHLVIRRTTDYRQAEGKPTKLGTYFRDGKGYAVNGYVEDDGQQLHFWVADSTKRVPAGKLTGQEFRAYVFSWDPDNAAGQTWWSGIPFGVTMSRDPIHTLGNRGFDASQWIGTWDMNHDGWGGRLEISSVAPLRVRYTPDAGESLDVVGSLVSPHELRLMIMFPDGIQPFTLLAHTWELGRFSGVTRWGGGPFNWGGRRFGVQGVKR